MGTWHFNAGKPCCDCDCDCDDSTPDQFQVVLAGLLDRDCNCATLGLNATYMLNRKGTVTTHPNTGVSVPSCRWRYTFGAAVCNFWWLDLHITCASEGVKLMQVLIHDGGLLSGDHYLWSYTHLGTCEITSQAFTLFSWGSDDRCHEFADPQPTCTVTAL